MAALKPVNSSRSSVTTTPISCSDPKMQLGCSVL
ncbi:unnamed protein product [Brassica napus]|uniref:(rape) hypothetical protein n=1 Tax=Brassica napus TaxID=3708 RepID=A0A816NXP6_BRANA|nr:unnamed protein product [Brassica napus]